MARLFTFEHAVKLLPRVSEALRQAVDLRSDYQEAEEEMNTAQQRILPFVNEHCRRRVQGLQMHYPVAHTAAAHNLVDSLRDVQQLHPLRRHPIDNAIEYAKSRRGGRLRGGVSRSVGCRVIHHLFGGLHKLLFMPRVQ